MNEELPARPKLELCRQLRYGRWVSKQTQEALAAELETTQARISSWEAGRSLPQLRTLPRLLRALRVECLMFRLDGCIISVFKQRTPESTGNVNE